MKKLFEISGGDWMKGLSVQATLPMGGIFRRATNFNPFEQIGTMSPGSTGTRLGSGTITTAIRSMNSIYHIGDGASRILAYGDNSSLYKIAPSSGTVTDISASLASGSTTARGSMPWRNKFVYCKDTEVRKFDLTGTFGANEAQLLSGLTTGVPHDPVIGADGNLYIPNGNAVAKLILETGTTGNSTSVFTIDSDMVIRQALNDGQFLVLLADNNSNNTNGQFRCLITFWDTVSGLAERTYDWYENRVYCMEMKDQNIYIHASDYKYVCNVATAPKAIFPFKGSNVSPSLLPSTIDFYRNSIVWARYDGTDDAARIDAYGNVLGGESIFYTPIVNTGDTTADTPTALLPYTYDGTNSYYFLAVTDSGGTNPRLYSFYYTGTEASATRTTSTIRVSDIQLSQPYKFEYAKIVLRQALSSGESVSFLMKAQGSSVTVSNTETLSTVGKVTKIFRPTPTTGTPEYIEQINDITITAVKAVVERVEVWGTPLSPQLDKL